MMVGRLHDCVVVTVAEGSAQVLASAMIFSRQLHTALTRRAVIDQAIGIVRARTGRDTREAFAQLRLRARTQNITLLEVSRRLVDDAIAAGRVRG